MKKRSSIIFSILVAFIAMILLSCSSVTNNLVEIDNIIYHECDGYYVADGPLKKNEDLYDAIIPEKINGKYVKEISDNAFDDCIFKAFLNPLFKGLVDKLTYLIPSIFAKCLTRFFPLLDTIIISKPIPSSSLFHL